MFVVLTMFRAPVQVHKKKGEPLNKAAKFLFDPPDTFDPLGFDCSKKVKALSVFVATIVLSLALAESVSPNGSHCDWGYFNKNWLINNVRDRFPFLSLFFQCFWGVSAGGELRGGGRLLLLCELLYELVEFEVFLLSSSRVVLNKDFSL